MIQQPASSPALSGASHPATSLPTVGTGNCLLSMALLPTPGHLYALALQQAAWQVAQKRAMEALAATPSWWGATLN